MNAAFNTAMVFFEEYGSNALFKAKTMLEEAKKQGASTTKIKMWADVCTILRVGA